MSVNLYNFDNFSDVSVATTGDSQITRGGDNQFTIINNMGVNSISFISSSTFAGPGGYAHLYDKQVEDILLVYGSLTTQTQHTASWKAAVEGQSPRTAAINWKIISSNDLTEVITGSGTGVAYAALFRPNAAINRVSVNQYVPEALDNSMRTISYSGSLYTQKKPAIAFASYTSANNAFQDYSKQFSAEVGDGAGDQNSMTYLQKPTGISTTAYAKYRIYDRTGSLRDINVKYDGGGTTTYYGSLHFD